MKKCLLAFLLLTVMALPARADSLTISGQNLSWTGSGSSPTFTVAIENPGGGVTDTLAGWQLGLSIAAQSGATGSLSFATATLPANYLLNGNSEVQNGMSFIPNDPVLPATSIPAIADVIATVTGVTVPAAGDNLLALTFSAAAGTTGVFDIYATAPTSSFATGSYWLDASFNNENFAQLSTGGGELLLGQITITPSTVIPEPQSVVLLVSGLAGAVGFYRRRRVRVR
jgi:hypothetical protein